MVVILAAFLLASLLPLTGAILLSRWRPSWTYLKVALVAAAPLPVLLTGLVLFFSLPASAGEVLGAIAIAMPLFVFGVMTGAVGAWMAPRPPAPIVAEDEIERIFS